MKNEQTTKEMIKEIDQVISFIDEWQKLNPYNPNKIEIFNKKFRADLKEFFNKSNFKHEKIEFYKTI